MSETTVTLINTTSDTTSSLDQAGIQTVNINFEFDENTYIEYSVYSLNEVLYDIDYEYNNYFLQDNISDNIDIDNITINPVRDLEDIVGVYEGTWLVRYNILKSKCGSSPTKVLYITDISPSRTEIQVDSDLINDFTLASETINFINERETSTYFIDFAINFGRNELLPAINLALDTTTSNTKLFIKLAEPLPPQYQVGSQLTVVERVSNTISYRIDFPPVIIDTTPQQELLPGPNLNLVLKDEFSKGTEYKSFNSITSTQNSSSLYDIDNILSSSGITINQDFTDFNDFIFFSDARTRLENFYYKMSLIESYSSSLQTQQSIPSNNTNIQIIEDNIRDIITNFDSYEKYLYYESGSYAWPKLTNTKPYLNNLTGSIAVREWIGSYDDTSQYYGGLLLSASDYDSQNRNNLMYSIPEFIRMDPQNQQYDTYVAMIGQYYDTIWSYTKDITNKLDADNRINFGISKDIVADALRDFGYKIYNNNYSSTDLYNAFFGYDGTSAGGLASVSLFYPLYYNLAVYGGGVYGLLPTGSSVALNFITSSADPIPLDDINKRVYKRIYHNHPFLSKAKGTKASIRALGNAYGVPDTLLQVSEFGAKDKSAINDWDFYKPIYNKAISTNVDNNPTGSIVTKWFLNSSWGITPSVPRTVELRFKSDLNPDTLPLHPNITQSIFHVTDDPLFDGVELLLHYNGSGSYTSSYSASRIDPLNEYADLILQLPNSASTSFYTASVNLPFLNQDWWSVMIHYDSGSNPSASFELYAANNIYHGDDGTKLGFFDSASFTLTTASDDVHWTEPKNDAYVNAGPGYAGGYQHFTGSVQEIRYWTTLLDPEKWKNHVMNPQSIEGNSISGSDSARESLAFRTREGEDINPIGYQEQVFQSIHPKVAGTLTTTSSFGGTNSNYTVSASYVSNNETHFLNQPIVGIKNRVSDRIRVENLEFPSGDTLSPFRRLQQNTYTSKSYTEGINYIEVGYSPSNEINDDIIAELGAWNIGEYIGDPRDTYDRKNEYPNLDKLRDFYFEKYIKNYDLNDFIKLIKQYDNSLFKMIKDLIPARNTAATGIIIKQHLLERQKYPEPLMSFSDVTYTGSFKSQPRGFITGSSIQVFSGGTGGMFEEYNGLTNRFNITQSYTETIITPSGSISKIHDTQEEFYNGELSGSNITITTQSLNPHCLQYLNIFAEEPTLSNFDTFVYNYTTTSSLQQFTDTRTQPASGELYLASNGADRITRIKISRYDKSGKDLFDILNPATRFAFQLEGNERSINVTRENILFDSFDYSTNNPIISLNQNNYREINFEATNGSGSAPNILSGFINGGAKIQEVIISSFETENDPHNLFDPSTGIYNTPYTPNRQAIVTASVDYTASFSSYSVDNTAAKIRLEVDGLQYGIGTFVQVPFLSDGNDQVFSGSLELTGSSNYIINKGMIGGVPLKLKATVEHPNISRTLSASYEFNNATFRINTSSVTDSNPVGILKSYEPYLGLEDQFNVFEHEFDCQPLLNNAVDIRKSTVFIDVDYSTGTVLPVNLIGILNRTAVKAEIPDSNYTSKSWSNLRYNGVKLSAAVLNNFTPPNTFILSDGTFWPGDKSYGSDPVIEQLYPNFGYFKLLVPTSPELEKATQVKLQYNIDQTGATQKPLLNTPAFFNVEGTYESNNLVDITLNDSFQTDGGNFPTNAAAGINLDVFNTPAKVIRGARRVDPILTTQVASIFDPDIGNEFSESISFTNPSGLDVNYSFQAGYFPNKSYNTNIGAAEFIVTASNEGYDPAGLYNANISTWENTTGEQFNLTPIRFRLQFNLLNTTDVFNVPQGAQAGIIIIKHIRPSIGQDATIGYASLPNQTSKIFNNGSVQAGDPLAVPEIVTPYIFPQAGDSVRVEVQHNALGNIDLGNVNFYGEPEELPQVEITGSFWRTGSAWPNSTQLTSSQDLAQYYNTSKQIQYPGSTFKPINTPFTIKRGDQFRFLGTETKVHTVSKVTTINTGAEAGNILVDIQPPIVDGINLDKFLIRRYVPDGSSVIIDVNPPSTGFGTTSGIIKNITNNNKLQTETNEIISTLIQNGTIS